MSLNEYLRHTAKEHLEAYATNAYHVQIIFSDSRRKQYGCSGFGWTSFSQGKNENPFFYKY